LAKNEIVDGWTVKKEKSYEKNLMGRIKKQRDMLRKVKMEKRKLQGEINEHTES
jgi:hypothetical protein